MTATLIFTLSAIQMAFSYSNFIHFDPLVPCDGDYKPEYCGLPNVSLSNMYTGEDFERCAPAVMPKPVRNYFWGAAGRKQTYMWNMESFKSIRIVPKMMRDVSRNSLSTTILGHRVSFPVGVSPVASHKLLHPEGELVTARVAASMGTIMILSSYSTTKLEDVASAFYNGAKRGQYKTTPALWLQTYIMKNRQRLLQNLIKAEKAGFKAIVVTIDSPVPKLNSATCNPTILGSMELPMLGNETSGEQVLDPSLTFEDLAWLRRNTRLPIVAKGILRGEDAIAAAHAGASAIMVSNHGGRELDSDPASIEVLPEIVEALKYRFPHIEVYMDGGIRNGFDVFKAIASGARAVFIGRPVMWGLAIGGEAGVRKVFDILKTEFNTTMLLAGINSPSNITSHSIRRHPYIPEVNASEKCGQHHFSPLRC